MTNEQAVEARWPAVLKLLGPKRKVTALLRDARVAAVQADDITLEFDYAFHAEQVEKPENRLVTEEALQQVYGRPLHARIVVKGATEHSTVAAGIKEPEEQHDTLDWADVEAWVKTHDKKLKPYQNSYGGYNIDCPIPTHQLKDQRLSIRPMKDGNVFLKCFGGCNYQDVRAAIAKEIKPPVVQAPTAPPLEALEQEWYSPEAQLALDQLVDEQLAEEQTAEYWDTQATAAKAEHDRENAARIDAENHAQELQALVDKLSAENARVKEIEALKAVLLGRGLLLTEDMVKEVGALQKSVTELAAKNSGLEKLRDEKEETFKELQTRLAAAEEKEDQRDQRISDLEPKALTFDFIAAWGDLEDVLKPLKKDLIQGYLRSGQNYHQAERRAGIRNQLDRALEKGYINKDQCLDLQTMQEQRNHVAHRGHQLTSKLLAQGYLEILEPVIDQLRQHSPRTSS